MNQELELLLHLASRRGISHGEVYQVTTQSQPIFFEGNRLKQLESSQSIGTALRLWQNNRPGLAVAYGNIEPELLVDRAISLSQLNEPETIELAPPRQAIHHLVGASLAVKDLIELGKSAIARLREEYPELICSVELESERETTTLINSQGLYCYSNQAGLSYYIGAELVRGEDFLGVYDGEYSRDKLESDVTQKLSY
ncbi:hypothetical protein IQ255_30765 [Pleurocapsales cyanobacterium LEGE 10410]|nr:hypothetical protein [Pleurocapsales cyanobacterium LEGE 10410]